MLLAALTGASFLCFVRARRDPRGATSAWWAAFSARRADDPLLRRLRDRARGGVAAVASRARGRRWSPSASSARPSWRCSRSRSPTRRRRTAPAGSRGSRALHRIAHDGDRVGREQPLPPRRPRPTGCSAAAVADRGGRCCCSARRRPADPARGRGGGGVAAFVFVGAAGARRRSARTTSCRATRSRRSSRWSTVVAAACVAPRARVAGAALAVVLLAHVLRSPRSTCRPTPICSARTGARWPARSGPASVPRGDPRRRRHHRRSAEDLPARRQLGAAQSPGAC